MKVSQDADYSKYQSGSLPPLRAGDPEPFPDADRIVVKPEKIIVQAHPDNDGFVVVGQAGTLNVDGSDGGYFLMPGQMQVLSGRDLSAWLAAGSGEGGQTLIYTYLSGAS